MKQGRAPHFHRHIDTLEPRFPDTFLISGFRIVLNLPASFENLFSCIMRAIHAIQKTYPVLWVLPHFLPMIDKCRWSTLPT